MPGVKGTVWIGAWVAVSLALATAQAGPDREGLAARKFRDGRTAFQKKRYDRALALFQSSLELMPSPNTRLYIGRCQLALGKVATAHGQLKLAADEARDRLKTGGEARYRATADTAGREAAAIAPRVPKLTVVIPPPIPEGLTVTIDGGRLAADLWGTPLDIDPGLHEVVATGPRLRRYASAVALAEREQKHVEVVIAKLPTAVVVLELATRPEGLAVFLDGQPVPPERFAARHQLDVGTHTVVARAPGHRDFSWRRELADGQVARVAVDLASRSRGTPRWLFWTVSAAAVATAAVGVGFSASAESAAQEQAGLDPLLRDPDVLDSIDGKRSTATVLYVGAGALAVTAGVLAFTTGWSGGAGESTAGLRAEPWIGPHGAGWAVRGRF